MFAPNEHLEMVIMYGECNRNANEATKQYAIRFPQRNHPSSNAFLRLIARAGTTGSLMPQKKGLVGVPRTARTPEAEENGARCFFTRTHNQYSHDFDTLWRIQKFSSKGTEGKPSTPISLYTGTTLATTRLSCKSGILPVVIASTC
jgi:hypothetical protein